MYYFYTITLPPMTAKTNPVVVTLPLSRGKITSMEIEFPLRCEGLAHVKINYLSKQLVPFNPPGDLYGDNRVFALSLNYLMRDPPYQLVCYGWNDDDTYPHTISIGIMVETDKVKTFTDLVLEGG